MLEPHTTCGTILPLHEENNMHQVSVSATQAAGSRHKHILLYAAPYTRLLHHRQHTLEPLDSIYVQLERETNTCCTVYRIDRIISPTNDRTSKTKAKNTKERTKEKAETSTQKWSVNRGRHFR